MSVRRVSGPVDFTWDDSAAHLDRGTFIDVPAGGTLETAIGAANLQTLADPPAAAVHAGAGN